VDIGDWLRGLGLERYEQAFRDNDVDAEVLPELTADDLTGLGVASIGHRRKLLAAIAALRAGPAPPAAAPRPAEPAPEPRLAARTGEAERRQLSVMFVDLAGSTALSARLDPEEMRELLGAYQRAVASEVARHGGRVAKYLGDGVLAYFGFPRAQEDDAERAVRAGLAAAAATAALPPTRSEPLAARVGIATGVVVVGDLIGEGAAREEAVVGETPNLAARLQALAEPGSVVVAEGTRRLVGGLFECLDLGAVAVKGFPGPVRAYRVLRAGAAESRFEALHATLTPLVGREEEVELLRRRWRQASGGEGRVVLLSGEPGIGKSRLLAAFQERIGGEPHVRLRYFCSPHREDSAFHPVIAQLERAAGLGRDDPPEGRLAKLEVLLAGTATPADDVALLAELLSVPTGDRYPPPALTPQRKRERTFEALLRQLEALARQGPVLAVFEDAHWIDPSSRELLDLMVARTADLPLLLVVTHRPEFQPPWTGQPHATTLVLTRLARREGASLVRRVAGADLPEALVEEIVERTDGVPLFVEELTKAVLEVGADATRTLGTAAPMVMAVPATLHASLLARLDRLGAAAREVAQVGAAIGREFPHELLAAVAGLDEDELTGALDQLAGAELVFRRGASPEAGYLFKHALVRDAAYGTLLRERRRRIHAGVARALEERFPGTTPELLAHHLTEAGEPGRAVRHWLEAGRRAADRSADREAVHHLRRGLELLAGLPASAGRDRLELDLQLAIGTPLIALHGWGGQPVAAAYDRAGALCESLGDDERLVPTLFGLSSNRVVRGETRTALRLAERSRAVAERRRDPVDWLLAHRATGAALMQLGELRRARAEFEAIPALYDPGRDRGLAARCVTDPHASGLSFLALVLWIMGYPDRARRAAAEASRCAAELGHANTIGFARCFAGAQLAELLRDGPAAEAHAEAVIALAAKHGMPMWRGFGLVLRGWALAEGGRPEDGASLVRQGIGQLDAVGNLFHRTLHLLLLAGIEARLGGPAAGLRVLEEADEEVGRSEVRLFEAELRRTEGELRLLAGRPEEAERCFAAALEVARRQEARSFELRAATALARLWQDQKKHTEAYDLLAPIHGWFTEGLGTPDLEDAGALLEGLRRRCPDEPRERSQTPPPT
jgi:class 3 adenylate cyclase/predicted ATPase